MEKDKITVMEVVHQHDEKVPVKELLDIMERDNGIAPSIALDMIMSLAADGYMDGKDGEWGITQKGMDFMGWIA